MPITVDADLSLTDRIPASFAAWVEAVLGYDDILPEGVTVPVLLRSVANLVPARDGLPCVIVTKTPGRSERFQNRLRFRDTFTPVVAIICEAAIADAAAAGSPWIGKLRDALQAFANTATYQQLPEFKRSYYDEAAFIDLTAFDQAKIRAAAVPFVIMCRSTQ